MADHAHHIPRIGLTGNIGSGKTTVARLFVQLGIPVYYADAQAKLLMVTNAAVRQAIIAEFGPEAYLEDLRRSNENNEAMSRANVPAAYLLNRDYLAQEVFTKPDRLAALNAIVHPAVAEDALNWHLSQQQVPFTLYEAAITFETGGYKQLDAVIVVTAPEDLRMQRVRQRDGLSEAQVRNRMDKQWPEEKKLELADYRITNDGKELLLPQVMGVYRRIAIHQK